MWLGNYSTRFLKATGGIGEALHVMEWGGGGFEEGQTEGSEERRWPKSHALQLQWPEKFHSDCRMRCHCHLRLGFLFWPLEQDLPIPRRSHHLLLLLYPCCFLNFPIWSSPTTNYLPRTPTSILVLNRCNQGFSVI